MRNILLFAAAIAAGLTSQASVPVVVPGSVTVSQERSRRVTIGYDLADQAAIVTIDILTNGVSIGAANTRGMYGDVHVKVEPGIGKKAYWTPTKSWPDHVITNGSMTVLVKAWATNAPPEYMIVNLDKMYSGRGDAVKYYVSIDQSPDGGNISNEVYKTSRLVLKRIPAAGVPFFMGALSTETGYRASASTSIGNEQIHRVVLSSDFYLAIYETTQAQYKKILNPSSLPFFFVKDGDCRPAEGIGLNVVRGNNSFWPGTTREEAYASVGESSLLGALRKHVGGQVLFDLPTEAQWEFACRAGVQTGLYTGEDIENNATSSNLDDIGRYSGNDNDGHLTQVVGNDTIGTNAATSVVGMFRANGFGLYDMLGNVQELCLDWKRDYDGSDEMDPVGISDNASDAYGSCRGGAYCFAASYCRCASRYFQRRHQSSRATGVRICVPLNP